MGSLVASQPLKERPARFLLVDTETTGLNASRKVVEIGIIYVSEDVSVTGNYDRVKMFSTLINSTSKMPDEAFAVHHISEDMLKSAPYPADAQKQIDDWIKEVGAKGPQLLPITQALTTLL